MTTEIILPEKINLTEFIAQEAHDLRSPFNRIQGFLKLVINGMDGPIPDMALDDLNTVFQNSTHAIALMNGLIDMARLDLGMKEFNPIDTPYEEIQQQTETYLKRNNYRSINLTFAAPANLILQTDANLLRTALINLISYAAEYVQDPVEILLMVDRTGSNLDFNLTSRGQKKYAPECDLTMFGYIGRAIVELHRGSIQSVQEKEDGLQIQFSITA